MAVVFAKAAIVGLIVPKNVSRIIMEKIVQKSANVKTGVNAITYRGPAIVLLDGREHCKI